MRKWVQQVVEEPLAQFLFAGALLFLAFGAIGGEDAPEESRQIVVDDAALLSFMQFRSKTVSPESFENQLTQLSPEQLQRSIDAFVREEALYREARALRLDQADYGVRQRIIRQLEFVNEGIVSSTIEVSDADLEKHLEQHADEYRVPETITFTHVFFSTDRHERQTEAQAHAELEKLNGAEDGTPVPFHEAPGRGDRFLYLQNYVQQGAAQVGSHFGAEAQRQIFSFEPDDSIWRGPVRSPYGYHLVLVTNKQAAYLPDLEQLRHRLTGDVYQARLRQALAEIESSVIESYDVQVDDALKQRLSSAESPK